MRELLNYRGAFQLVSEYLGGGEPVTEGLIREIHKRLVEGVRGGSGGPGAYRTIQNYVANSATGEIVYTPPSPVGGSAADAGAGGLVAGGERRSSCARRRHRPVPARAYPSD